MNIRRHVTVAAALSVIGVACLTACGGSGDPAQTQAGNTDSRSVLALTPRLSPTPNIGYGAAQPAVDTYLRFSDAFYAASRDPSRGNQMAAENYLQGQALAVIKTEFEGWTKNDVMWTGTPPTSQLAIEDDSQLNSQLPLVRLSSCVIASPAGWRPLEHGTPAATASPAASSTVYARTLTMIRIRGVWTLDLFDTSKTRICSR